MARTIKTLGQAARHRMLVRSRCRKCKNAASFTADSLAGIFGHGREIRSLKFRCKDCNSTDCEVLPYEDIFERKAKPQPVQVQIDTSENGTIGAMIDHGYTLWVFCQRRGCKHSVKDRSADAGEGARQKPQRHAQGPRTQAEVLGVRIKAACASARRLIDCGAQRVASQCTSARACLRWHRADGKL